MAARVKLWELYEINRALRATYGSNAHIANIQRGKREGDVLTFRGTGRCPRIVTVEVDAKAKRARVVNPEEVKKAKEQTREQIIEAIAGTDNIDFLESLLGHDLKTVASAARKRMKKLEAELMV